MFLYFLTLNLTLNKNRTKNAYFQKTRRNLENLEKIWKKTGGNPDKIYEINQIIKILHNLQYLFNNKLITFKC